MQETLSVVVILVGVLVVGAIMEHLRHTMLRNWVHSHPEARLHWGFVPDDHPTFPAVQLATELLGRAPPRWALALETPSACLAELSISRSAGETSKWYVLVAKRASDGTWNCKLETGLITRVLLDATVR